MKPETLLLKNFGPFYGEHKADFKALGDFFLICGETGAGKTTLFDAVSYAFYGEAPGSRKGLVRQMRSQYAGNEEESCVELVFSLGADKWKIKRTLPYEKTGVRSKKIQTVPEEVSLAKKTADGWRNESCTNKNETDKKILSLIKLSADEFSRIVLLPQGDFSRFLRQNSEERKDILAKLFPVSVYREAAETARENAKSAEAFINGLTQQILLLQQEFNPETFEDEKKSLEKNLKASRAKDSEYQKQLVEKSALLEKAKRIAKNIQELSAAEEEYEEKIKDKKDLYTEWKEKLSAAERAAPIAGLIMQYKSAEKNLEENESKYKEKSRLLLAAEKECGELEKIRGKIEGQKQTLNALIQRKPLIEAAAKTAGELRRAEQNLPGLEGKAQELKESLRATLTKLSGVKTILDEKTKEKPEITVLAEARTKAETNYEYIEHKCGATLSYLAEKEKAEKQKTELDTLTNIIEKKEEEIKTLEEEIAGLQNKYNEQANSGMAAVLASSLKDNTPCPVCGSLHHPSPAVEKTDDLLSCGNRITELTSVKQESEKETAALRETLMKIKAEYLGNVSFLKKQEDEGVVFSTKEEAEKNKNTAAAEKEKAEKEYTRAKEYLNCMNELQGEKEELEQEKIRKEKTITETENSVELLRMEIKNMRTRFNEAFPGEETAPEKAVEELELCKKEIERLQDSILSFEKKDKAAHDEKSRHEGSVKELETLCAGLSKQLEEITGSLHKGYIDAGFADYNEAEKSVISAEEKKDLSDMISSFDMEKMKLENRISFLETELEKEGVDGNNNFIDEKTAEEEYNRIYALLESNKAETESINIRLVSLKEKMKRWKNLVEEHREKTDELSLLKQVADDLLGRNPRNIKFEAWILNKYLEEVTEYANMRIARMSGGRYRIQTGSSFRKGNSMTGLDLEIFDNHTGKTRPTGTLSGGETFMASISLALGLADSIQARSGGIQLEAVFIDEGFGSLDETCLELAMNIFDEIRGQRTVGIISHVRELQDRIPKKLEVRKKTTEGSYIKQEENR